MGKKVQLILKKKLVIIILIGFLYFTTSCLRNKKQVRKTQTPEIIRGGG